MAALLYIGLRTKESLLRFNGYSTMVRIFLL
eukprot:CAMPEP_0204833218 /NCGR_PEP_ID=MMETSP1346-20131115/16012_1 /ASSEMBLY_ACC=CAM_ASM_000771 /TAXON_ID=215587 /ORGANISM="Aplanochytrium stocchinoi, Strain GSBS06" /LENGTH=30 /DNA_ID= /DNA_START= /DNA_END= /DNA_ORIENTATION=